MYNVLEGSLLFHFLTAAAHWVDRQWQKSCIAYLLTSQKTSRSGTSVFSRVFSLLHRALHRLFCVTRLDRALEGSIFSRLFFWCGLTVFAAPLLPTMAVLALSLLSCLALLVKFGREWDAALVWSPLNQWIWLYAAVYLVCTFTSVSRDGSMHGGLLTAVFVLFAVVLQNAVTERRQLDRLIYLLVAGGFLVSLYGFLQVFTGAESADAWVDEDAFSTITQRVYSTLDNPNVLSEYLLLILPLGAACAINARTAYGRAAGVAATGCMLLCMALTYSRGGWLGLALSIALFLVLLDRRFVVLGLIALLCLPFVLPDTIWTRLTSVGDLSDGSTSYRLYIWLGTLSMLKDYWFCGIGTGISAYTAVYPRYSYNAVSAPHAHNLFLQVMCECGICGLVILLGLIVSFYRALSTRLKKAAARRERIQIIALLSGMLGFLFQSMTDYSFYNYRVELVFWIVIALGACMARGFSEEADA